MRVLIINSVCGIGSTGRICTELALDYEKHGHEVFIAYGRNRFVPERYKRLSIRIGNDLNVRLHGIYSRLFDAHGLGSKRATKSFLKWVDEFKPDLLWLHNIHGYYINYEILFSWIKSHSDLEIRWTLHDCWAFTGHCAYFSASHCEQWKTQCNNCSLINKYPACITKGNVKRNYERKKAAFTGVGNLTLITPSKWLAGLVKRSFLNEYPIEVVYNSINHAVFKPMNSNLREQYNILDKIIILGVASNWDDRKGLSDFYKLALMLDTKYVIVLVGLNRKQIAELQKYTGFEKACAPSDNVYVFNSNRSLSYNILTDNKVNNEFDFCGSKKHQRNSLAYDEILEVNGNYVVPQNVESIYEVLTNTKWQGEKNNVDKIICIMRTESPVELAKIYSSADFFINPTIEDNYPTVNLEAIACGTRVITYDTGGCRETLETRNEN